MDWWPDLAGKCVTVECFNLSYPVHIFLYIIHFIYLSIFAQLLLMGKDSR